MKKLCGLFKLLWLRLVVGCRDFVEFVRVAYRYYPNATFRKLDVFLLRNYLLESPYRISRDFLQSRGVKEIYAYGETPLTTLERIARKAEIQASDVVYELGAGRARTCFWLNVFVGCRVVAVEYVPAFVRIAQQIKRKFGIEGVSILSQDILEVDYSDATVIYFYGTCSEEPLIEKLIEKLAEVRPGTKIITVSYPLTDYTKKPLFELRGAFPAQFTWGVSTVYLQIRK